jgi:isocitrate dehydrogenase (NAD+)
MYKITLIPGDGVGPEITEATKRVLEATGVSIEWDIQDAGEDVYHKEGSPLPERVLESIRNNKIAINPLPPLWAPALEV